MLNILFIHSALNDYKFNSDDLLLQGSHVKGHAFGTWTGNITNKITEWTIFVLSGGDKMENSIRIYCVCKSSKTKKYV